MKIKHGHNDAPQSPERRPTIEVRNGRPVTSRVVETSASTSGGQRFMRVTLPAMPWEIGE